MADLPLEKSQEIRAHRHEQKSRWALWFFAAIALFYLLSEHQAHFFGALPYLLLLACPLMHLFMHHGAHSDHKHQDSGENNNEHRH